jgi:hypothetical protein
MPYTPIQFPAPALSFTDGEVVTNTLQASIVAQSGTQLAKLLNFNAYISFAIPAALEADYNAASQAKKEVMARIYFEIVSQPATDFDTQYTARYTELYP